MKFKRGMPFVLMSAEFDVSLCVNTDKGDFMQSRFLVFSILLVALLTRPRSWVVSGVAFLILLLVKFFGEGVSLYFKHWNELQVGMLNPEVPVEQKLFVVGFFFLLLGISMFYTNIFKEIIVYQYKRFGEVPCA